MAAQGKPFGLAGPFTETKEQVIGRIALDAADMDDALAIASEIPLVRSGHVEVREAYSILD